MWCVCSMYLVVLTSPPLSLSLSLSLIYTTASYSRIARRDIDFSFFTADSTKALLEDLLALDPATRLGAPPGSEDFLSHPFFASIDVRLHFFSRALPQSPQRTSTHFPSPPVSPLLLCTYPHARHCHSSRRTVGKKSHRLQHRSSP